MRLRQEPGNEDRREPGNEARRDLGMRLEEINEGTLPDGSELLLVI